MELIARVKRFFNFRQKRIDRFWSEKWIKRSLDKNACTYYIIRRADTVGLFSVVNTTLGHIQRAVKQGFVPVVDMMNYPNAYLAKEKLGIENAWEYFFEQPCNATVDEAKKGKKIVLSSGAPVSPRPDDTMSFFDNVDGELDMWRGVAKKYLRIRAEVMEDIDREYRRLFLPQDRVLGVILRGTDYVAKRPKGHPVSPDIKDVLEKTREVMAKYHCNKVFVGTEDKKYDMIFREQLGEAYISNDCPKVDYQGGITPLTRIERDRDEYLQGKEYLTTIVLLSRCNCFIGSRTSGAVGVMMLSSGFEFTYLYDLGRYA